MSSLEFEDLIREAERARFEGWDFSWIQDRIVEESLPWVYAERVKRWIPNASSMLDVGTGGGERLAAMALLPPVTVATETHEPNVIVAARRLKPLGAWVVHAEAATHNMLGPDDLNPARRLPFADASFDLVVSRHSSFAATEVARILRPGGRVITQQVEAGNDLELNEFLGGAPKQWPVSAVHVPTVEDAGLHVVERTTARYHATFLDVGAVVYHLRAIPWQLEGFSSMRYREKLEQMHEVIKRDGGFRTTRARSYLEAVKA